MRLICRMHKFIFWRFRKVILICGVLLVSYNQLQGLLQWTENSLPEDDHLDHLRRNRSLAHYLDNIELLFEPPSTVCEASQHIPVMVLVASSPGRRKEREAIRRTWARWLTAYFVLGLQPKTDLNETINEAESHKDIILFNFTDHYQNLTLKTGLMLRWIARRCPRAGFLYKLDDDVLLNPWTLSKVLKEHPDAQLLGFTINNARLFRGRDEKYYVPKWLHYEDYIPHFLTGPGYLINGNLTSKFLQEAYHVPLINLEDVYYTNLVATRLRVNLTHDYRLGPYRAFPKWLASTCSFWLQASSHSLGPEEMLDIWPSLEELATINEKGGSVCYFYDNYVKRFVHMNF